MALQPGAPPPRAVLSSTHVRSSLRPRGNPPFPPRRSISLSTHAPAPSPANTPSDAAAASSSNSLRPPSKFSKKSSPRRSIPRLLVCQHGVEGCDDILMMTVVSTPSFALRMRMRSWAFLRLWSAAIPSLRGEEGRRRESGAEAVPFENSGNIGRTPQENHRHRRRYRNPRTHKERITRHHDYSNKHQEALVCAVGRRTIVAQKKSTELHVGYIFFPESTLIRSMTILTSHVEE